MIKRLIILIVLFCLCVSQAQIAQAHRCKPASRDFQDDLKGPYWMLDCMTVVVDVYGEAHIEMIDCTYWVYTVTCRGVYCDEWDNSMYLGSDCTIDDQPPGNKPIMLPTPCNSDDFVSYIWQSIINISNVADGCSAICWGCLPWEVPTKSLAEGRCKDGTHTVEPLAVPIVTP